MFRMLEGSVHDPAIYPILERVVAGERLSDADAVRLFQSHDLLAIGRAAQAVRWRLHPEPVVTYVIDRNINYTNICITDCSFCAFYRKAGDADAYVRTREELRQKIEETFEAGGSQILMQGGLNPELDLAWYEDLLRWMKQEFPGLHIHAFSPTEISFFRDHFGLRLEEVLRRLRAAGLDSIPGGGAEILSDRVRRKISPDKTSADDWLEVMRVAHRLGMRTSATMMFGIIETMEERVEHLRRLRELQDETGGFTAFIDWTFQPKNTPYKDKFAGAFDYLRTTAIARLYLDNFENIQASWVTQGDKIAQLSLTMGVNDLGSLMLEENVVAAAGTNFMYSRRELARWAADLGFELRQRDYYYRDYVHPAAQSAATAGI
ncbi:MAG TPA: cyclic dehypoxanthinyl futalosine synthase [Candidatus Sumerlaeota bacterium]|nr:cyclic dehypoxanthinyl futalosine synthase [Candidatus Sumerlaeota bacterium]HPK03775.1 cyclic dehypoxanthinyl futalosine synthase [Candidatus Sumerlaeota bacterium]